MSTAERIGNWYGGLIVPGCPDEYEAKNLLRLFEIPVPAGIRIRNSVEKAAVSQLSPPYAVKVCSPEVLHKTELDGVRIGVGPKSVDEEIDGMFCRFPGKHILVEEMVVFEGPEFIVGGILDPDFGRAIMTGSGGTLSEIYSDVVFRLIPITVPEAANMLNELKISPVLRGYRGSSLPVKGLAELVSAAGMIMERLGDEFLQLDLNPVVVYGEAGWTVLDAKDRAKQLLPAQRVKILEC